jgi:hypothetical protein
MTALKLRQGELHDTVSFESLSAPKSLKILRLR